MASGFALVSCAGMERFASAAACPPVAIVQGPADVVAPIRAILHTRGVASDPTACSAEVVHASVTAGAGSKAFILHIEDAFGRTSDHRVSDAETAASLIESWALPEEEHLPSPRPLTPSVGQEPALVRAGVATSSVPWRLLGALEVGGSGDGAWWSGAMVSGCRRIASACVGARARVARDDMIETHDRGDVTRTETELLILAGRPFIGRKLTATPMMGLGVGWTHFEAVPPGTDLDAVPSEDLGVRLEAGASTSMPVSAHLSLVGEVSVSRGWSLLSSAVPVAGGVTPRAPTSQFRAAIGCQYAP